MEYDGVQGLGHSDIGNRNANLAVDQGRELSTIETRDADRLHVDGARVLDSAQDIARISRAADGDEKIARLSEIAQLLLEHALVAHVVRERSDVTDVVGERDRPKAAGRIDRRQCPLGEILREMR